MRLYTGLYPTGYVWEPCELVCSSCGVLGIAENLVAAQGVAWLHDLEHDAATRAQEAERRETYAKDLNEQ